MKKIFLSILLIPFLGTAQDCEVKKDIDPYTKEIRISSGFMSFKKGIEIFLLSIDATKTDLDFFFSLNKSSKTPCFDANSTLTILFEETKSKSNFRNTGSMNCEGLFHFNFRNSNVAHTNLTRLATMKLKSFIFTGSDRKIKEIFLNKEEQILLMEKVACIVKEAKTLLPQ